MDYVPVYNAFNLIYKLLIKPVTKQDLIMFSVSLLLSSISKFLIVLPHPFLYEMLFSDVLATC